jgi:DNA-binding IclR family transcriptional regulator
VSEQATERRGQAEVRSLAKGLEILSLFRTDRPVLTVEEMARELNFPKSSTYRLVATLRERGYLRKNPGGEGYALDDRLLHFGEVVRSSSKLHDYAHAHLEKLAASSGETAVLVVLNGSRGVVVDKADSPEMIRFMPDPGWNFPLHVGAAGKVFLAAMSPRELNRYLERELERPTERTITDPEELRRELAKVREQGYATIDEEFMLGTRSVAAPVRGHGGKPIASMAIAGPSSRLTSERIDELASLVIDEANALATAVGGDGSD